MSAKILWAVGGFVAAAALLVAVPRVIAEPKLPRPACTQWELTVANPAVEATTGPLPTVGTMALPSKAPPGWEPFAYAPGGQVAYRRCTAL